jgi:GTP-binding protein HflX
VGVLVNRAGQVESVIVGDASKLMLPDIGRLRAAAGRFRGIRLIHTHLRAEPLTRDDLVDLSRLRLDLVAAVQVGSDGAPGSVYWAHLLPENPRGDLWREYGPVPLHRFVEEEDFVALVRSLEEEFARISRGRSIDAKDGRAVLVHVSDKKNAHHIEDSLRELRELARTAGVEVADEMVQVRDQIDPRYVLGKGKLDEVVLRAMQLDAEVLIFDRNLAPAQAAGIAAITDLKVIDRTQLILDIFAQRADSRDGKLQVELAQLKYMLPRLGQKDDSLSRLTGGIGGRGPGETKLEIAGRRARDRIAYLEQQLKDLGKQRRQRRGRRAKSGMPTAAIIGYTNAGKSTLLNTLTKAGVLAEDKLFATLDPRSRRLDLRRALTDLQSAGPGVTFHHGTLPPPPPDDDLLADGALDDGEAAEHGDAEAIAFGGEPSREIIVTDTVGFIRELPKDLVAAFRATFEEAAEADLLIHLVDASDARYEDQMETTDKLIDELGLREIPRLLVFNKIDAAPPGVGAALARAHGGVAVSAHDPATLVALLQRLEHQLFEMPPRVRRDERELPPWAVQVG